MEKYAHMLLDALLAAGSLTLAVLLPLFAFGIAMHLFSAFFRRSLTLVFGTRFTAYLTAPGVILHELSHALGCLLFGHKIKKVALFSPQKNGTLGFVEHCYDPRSYRQKLGHFFIGTAPLWVGYGVIFGLTILLVPREFLPVPENPFDCWRSVVVLWGMFFRIIDWKIYLWLYLILVIGSQITLSRSDLEGARMGVPLLFFLLFFLALAGYGLEKFGVRMPSLMRGAGFQAGILCYILSVLAFFALLLKLCLAGTKK